MLMAHFGWDEASRNDRNIRHFVSDAAKASKRIGFARTHGAALEIRIGLAAGHRLDDVCS